MADYLRAMEVKVGALILVSVVVLVGFVFLLGDFRCSEDTTLYLDVASSSNLKVGAPVKVSGVTVGKVAKVSLWGGKRDKEHNNKPVYVRVTLRVAKEVLPMLHEDARFYITTLGPLGEKYVEVDPGSEDKPSLWEGAVVDGVEPLRLEALGGDAATIARELAELLKENREDVRKLIASGTELVGVARDILNENREEIRAIVHATKESAENLAKVSEALKVATSDGKDLSGLLKSAKAVAEKMDQALAPTLSRLQSVLEKIDSSAAKAEALLQEGRDLLGEAKGNIVLTLEHLEALLKAARDGKGSIGALLSDREIYDDLVALIKDLKRNPWKLLMKP